MVNVFATYNLLFNDASPPKKSRPFAEISLFAIIAPCDVNVFATYNLLFNEASPPTNNRPFAEISLFAIINP